MKKSLRYLACVCFVLSGAASVSYQMVWLRDAMTHFGVVTPVISSVLSVFMLGLAVGTLAFGRIARTLSPRRALIFYAIVELAIGALALLVPAAFEIGYTKLLSTGTQESGAYLFFSWGVITLVLLPVCTLIGATLPLILRFLESQASDGKSFGHLYFANLIGAVLGCFLPLVWIELYGFSGALHVTVAYNVAVALLAFGMLRKMNAAHAAQAETHITEDASPIPAKYLAVLFVTGFAALGSEVVWIRAFTPAVSTTVYAFAAVLAIYLAGNFLGTRVYLKRAADVTLLNRTIYLLPAAALLPILGSSMPVMDALHFGAVFFIGFVCFAFGYITPQIIDTVGKNNPNKTARAYVWNFAGCILGPLATTYLLFPVLGLKGTVILYAVLLISVPVLLLESRALVVRGAVAFVALLAVCFVVPDFEDDLKRTGTLHRDHVGYVGANGEGMKKLLTVNGIGMTYLTTITKNMSHLPMVHHPEAKSALVICFGMGTTVRSFTSWPGLEKIHAAELSRAVVESFPYFHADTDRVMNDPRVKIHVDDGRRYLNRTSETYDVITIDPPPPIRASGSGLLYSAEFLQVLKKRLAKDGVLAHWLPAGDALLTHAVVRSIQQQFKYVKLFHSMENWGIHILASDAPIPDLTAEDYVARMPASVRADALEWQTDGSLEKLAELSMRSYPPSNVLLPDVPDMVIQSDNHLYNEFYKLRKWGVIAY